MIEFNDSNADVTRNGVSIFFEPVDIDDDVFIGSSCIFMDDFHTTGSLKAQYSLTVHGSLSVDGELKIGEDLTCASLSAVNADIERNLSVREDVSAQKIFIGGNADIGNIFAHTVTSYSNVYAREGIDIQGDMEANMAVIGLDYISVSGCLKCAYAVSPSIDVGDDQIGSITVTEQKASMTEPEEAEDKHVSIAESELKDIFDGNSQLAIEMEDYALLLDKLNERLCKMEPSETELLNLLDAYGSFIPTYLDVLRILDDSLDVVTSVRSGDIPSFQDLLTCGHALLLFPDWFKGSIVVDRYINRLKAILEDIITSKSRTNSKSEWIQGLGLVGRFKEQYPEEEPICSLMDELSELLFRNTGLKPLTVKLYLPKE